MLVTYVGLKNFRKALRWDMAQKVKNHWFWVTDSDGEIHFLNKNIIELWNKHLLVIACEVGSKYTTASTELMQRLRNRALVR